MCSSEPPVSSALLIVCSRQRYVLTPAVTFTHLQCIVVGVRHLIRLKLNPLRSKQLIWQIIQHHLLTPRCHTMLDFSTQPAWDQCAEGFVCLLMTKKVFCVWFPAGFVFHVQHEAVFNKDRKHGTKTKGKKNIRLCDCGSFLFLPHSRKKKKNTEITQERQHCHSAVISLGFCVGPLKIPL